MKIIITDNPRNRKIPEEISSDKEKMAAYFAGGKVTVLRCTKVTKKDFVYFYIPRIRGFNIESPLHKTPEKAYQTGLKVKQKCALMTEDKSK